VSLCARSASLARHAVNALSAACCFTSAKHNPRDDFKTFRGSRPTRDSATELGWGVSAAAGGADDDDDAGSGDEDVLTSLGASYRAWRAYHREKRAHDYTKSRLADWIWREAAAVKQLARVGGNAQGVERTLMRLEDLEAAVVALETKYNTTLVARVRESSQASNPDSTEGGEHEPRARETLERELESLQQQNQENADHLGDVDAATLHWKTERQRLLSELAACQREKKQLVGELRNVKKTAALMANRQYVQLCSKKETPQSVTRSQQSQGKSKRRSYSDIAEVSAAV
jgi:hypothetical protein